MITRPDLTRDFWGWTTREGVEAYRAPLPPTDRFPVVQRRGAWGQVEISPYLLAALGGNGVVDVMLCDGGGTRCGWGDSADDPESTCIYVGAEDVPEEWREPVEKALDEVRSRWGDRELSFRPDVIA